MDSSDFLKGIQMRKYEKGTRALVHRAAPWFIVLHLGSSGSVGSSGFVIPMY